MTNLQNKPNLGSGIYTPPDISLILKIPQHRIRWYVAEIWDNRFGKRLFGQRYSWSVGRQKAVNFLVLIEFKVVLFLRDLGLSTHSILKARKEIARDLHLPYPFATSSLLANSSKIWYRVREQVVDADETHQLNFAQCVEEYCKHIDFGQEDLANRLWPDGRDSSVVVDPHHQFGQPTIEGTNITAETIFRMHESGESIFFPQ